MTKGSDNELLSVHVERFADSPAEPDKEAYTLSPRRPVSTPSTASVGNMSRPASRGFSAGSRASSAYGSRPVSSASRSSGFRAPVLDEEHMVSTEEQLVAARQRSSSSMEALQKQLNRASTTSRYASWPLGCPVLVSCDTGADSSGRSSIRATLVGFDAPSNTFSVQLEDKSTRVVPTRSVTRSFARSSSRRTTATSIESSSPQVPGCLTDQEATGIESLRTTAHSAEARQPPALPQFRSEPEPQKLGRMQSEAVPELLT